MNIPILAEYRKEFSFKSEDTIVVSLKGLARLCGVTKQALSQNLTENRSTSDLAFRLRRRNYDIADLLKNGFDDIASSIVICYYAMYSRNCTEKAKAMLEVLQAIGARVLFKQVMQLNETEKEHEGQPSLLPNTDSIGAFFTSGTTRNGYLWRLFWYHVNGEERHLIPVIFKEDNWYVQIRAVRTAFNANYSMSIDWELDLDEFEWMFTGTPLEKHGNFSNVTKVRKVLKQHDSLKTFDDWANQLNVFVEPKKEPKLVAKEETKSLKKEEPQLVVKEEATLGDVKEMSDSLTVFHSFAMRLINEVHKDNVMKMTNEQLKRGMLEVAFDMLKFVSNV